ncbi:hypothetical protein AAG570_008274 [Ranatra chinensis]|uniref:Integrase zinc-binding domain-containing protein n=1 Tax=Ranatra chinensis TaxID=642074 RepID=A0ABD0XSN9_9HEMI
MFQKNKTQETTENGQVSNICCPSLPPFVLLYLRARQSGMALCAPQVPRTRSQEWSDQDKRHPKTDSGGPLTQHIVDTRGKHHSAFACEVPQSSSETLHWRNKGSSKPSSAQGIITCSFYKSPKDDRHCLLSDTLPWRDPGPAPPQAPPTSFPTTLCVLPRLPPFWTADSVPWFIQVEAIFATSCVNSQIDLVVRSLDYEVIQRVADTVQFPSDQPYVAIKSALIEAHSRSGSGRALQLLGQQMLGDRKQPISGLPTVSGQKLLGLLLKTPSATSGRYSRDDSSKFIRTKAPHVCLRQPHLNAPPRHTRQLTYIIQFTMARAGSDDPVADALSRIEELGLLNALDTITKAQKSEEDIVTLLLREHNKPKWLCLPGVDCNNLCDNSTGTPRVYLPTPAIHRHRIPRDQSPRCPRYKYVTSKYWWPAMDKDMTAWVKTCTSCQKAKVSRHTLSHPHQLGRTATFSQWWATCRWVHSMARAIPLGNPTAENVTQAFFLIWVSRFGVHQRITTDQEKQFESGLIQITFKSSGDQTVPHDSISPTIERHGREP